MTPIRGSGRPGSGGYKNAEGKRVPSVTTITGFLKSKSLLQWAYNRGRDGHELYGSRDAAAEAGTIVHQWIEDNLHRKTALLDFPDAAPELIAQAQSGYAAFLDWRGQVQLELLETEIPLLSEEYGYGGTLDAVAVLNGERGLFDWKTSNGTYPDYIAQVAAYRQLLRERDGEEAPRRAYLLRVGKEFADFHFHSWPEAVLDLGWRWFLGALEIYRADARLRKVAA